MYEVSARRIRLRIACMPLNIGDELNFKKRVRTHFCCKNGTLAGAKFLSWDSTGQNP